MPYIPKKDYFLLPDTHIYMYLSGVKECSFFRKFDVLCFLETTVFRFALLLITDEFQSILHSISGTVDHIIEILIVKSTGAFLYFF